MAKSPILGGFSTQISSNAADNTAINLNVEIIETQDGKVPGFLRGSSGLDLITNVGPGPVRGMGELRDTLYVVSGREVWTVSANGPKSLVGTISDLKSPVSMFQNSRQLLMVDGVGAWLVPGGFPLISGTMSTSGGLYKPNDIIVLKAATGVQSAYPEVKVTAITDAPATFCQIVNAGSGYSTGVAATTHIQPFPGHGTGLTLNLTAVSGTITAAAINAGGTGYAVNDTGAITGGGRHDGVYLVTGVTAGVVTSLILLNGGLGYSSASGVVTAAIIGNMVPNLGTGLTLNIVAAGAISASSIANGGRNYALGNYGYISGGGGDATFVVNQIGQNGSVTAFTIITPGAITDTTPLFTQKSTTGSGAGFTLTAPSYGAFVGLVPIEVPFANPIVGSISDGFGLLVFLNSQNLAASDELDLSTWRPLSFGVANQSPDTNISVAVIHDEVFVLKERNTEVWIDQGLANFPFGPITSVHIEFGCMAPFSVAKADSELIFLSRNDEGEGVVVMLKGYAPVPISTQALVNEFQTYANLGDAIAYARQEGQHTLYVITFPEANKTWQYDKTASALAGYPIWTQLAAFDDGELNRHWGNCFSPFSVSEPTTATATYQAGSVMLTSPTLLETTIGIGIPATVPTVLLSLWIEAPDAAGSGVIFSNQNDDALGSPIPGLFVKIQNDTLGTPQMTIAAWDNTSAPIFEATYDFTAWTRWVNILISIDTPGHLIQVYANTIVGGNLVENHLTPTSLSWSSSNFIGVTPTQPWHVVSP